jgi:hypothetical protein
MPPLKVDNPFTSRVDCRVVAPVTPSVPPTVALLVTATEFRLAAPVVLRVVVATLPLLAMPLVVVAPVTPSVPPTVAPLLTASVPVVVLPVTTAPALRFACQSTSRVE